MTFGHTIINGEPNVYLLQYCVPRNIFHKSLIIIEQIGYKYYNRIRITNSYNLREAQLPTKVSIDSSGYWLLFTYKNNSFDVTICDLKKVHIMTRVHNSTPGVREKIYHTEICERMHFHIIGLVNVRKWLADLQHENRFFKLVRPID